MGPMQKKPCRRSKTGAPQGKQKARGEICFESNANADMLRQLYLRNLTRVGVSQSDSRRITALSKYNEITR
jgi:hypothetical protein